ncbi:MAG: PEP-CTERM sorting domain-containing protein [Phycisphaera sp.]|nr:PEP-CTERM sorting domain-containing protein [Phycisphaera sp.]
MNCTTRLAAMLAAAVAAAASAETVTLDFASDEDWGGFNGQYDVSAENLHWWGDGYATEGVLFGWDHASENPGPAIGSLAIFAAAGFEVGGVSFDLSGYREVAASATYDFLVDGVSVASGDLDFEGDSSLFEIDLDPVMGSSVEIVLDNYYRPSYVGLDNVTFSINAVPAPGALALLGVAGIVGGRRRRTA